ncbi:hypothetical protein CASFOL_005700 [Castilleja foliolosa]|uniref:Uncharacterized protein n=1 Tax=Castilleja foliolosa TaxID=1961234 RepID=A0ABD3E663_9LAMI
MGGVIEGGVGIADKTSPRRSTIEKAQAELRLKYETRDKTKRELEFLLEGGDPLELECVNAVSVSVQSTSFTDQHPDQFVSSKAKGSFTFTESPHGDSVESSGRLGTNTCEPNSSDNLFLFDAEREVSEGNRSKLNPTRSNIVSSENLSIADGNRRTREHGDSAAFGLPRKAYKRRYRSRPNRDGTRSSSTDVNPTCGSHGYSLPSRHGPRDDKGLISDVENRIISTSLHSKPTSLADDAHKTGLMDSQQDIELDGITAVESTKDLTVAIPVNAASDTIACETPLDDQRNKQSLPGVLKTPILTGSDEPEAIQATEGMTFEDIECQPGVTVVEVENKTSSSQMNVFISKKGDRMKNDAHKNSASCGMKGLDSESSCTQARRSIDGNNDTEMCTKMRTSGSNGQIKDQSSIPDKTPILEGDDSEKVKKETGGTDTSTLLNVESSFSCQSQQENGVKLQPEDELNRSESALENDLKDQIVIEGVEACRITGSEPGRKSANTLGDVAGPNNEHSCTIRHQDSIDVSFSDLPGGVSLTRASTVNLEAQMSSGSDPKLATKIDEESILKEAQIIEVKRKRIAELSVATAPKRIRVKSHWDYVLEEMAWLANDFAQERVWKIAAAVQISSQTAFACQLRKQENNFHLEAKKVAHTLAKSVTQFWQLVEEKNKVLDQQSQIDEYTVQAYAVRFLKYNNCNIVYNQAEVPLTPDRVSDIGIIDSSWKANLTEENLFYTVFPGTMETYRSSVESHVAQFQRIKSGVLEEVETPAFDAAADFKSQDNAYEEEERETNTYGTSMAFEDSKSSRFGQKKQKHLIHSYGVRSHEVSSDISHMQGAENKVVHRLALLEKRPGGNLDASIPRKRIRTASRRVVGPFSAGTSGFPLVLNKTDASSGDTTTSFQDDQSTLRGGSLAPYSLEVESAGKFEKQLSIESPEVSMKHRKKKKAKHLNATYEPRWKVDPTFQDEQFQRGHSKSHHLESNCNSGLLGQPMAKKPKTMRQTQDSSFENITPLGGSVPSPAASQMSNMSNPNKFIKMLGGRDRGRKHKILKMPVGQPGSGSPWTLFEDQALVVLAHDLGPNWELVSDAINSTLQFKCIFRKAKECKERHNFLMDRTSGDGADSAEDSGSSQPYSSTLPGIPKGSARQLFQRLQGPMEEDTLKSHFDKIIIIGQKQLYRKSQDPKQLQHPHSSHTVALSQVCPNNLNGGPILTPLDLCEATTIAGTDMLHLGYPGPHSGGLALPNQGTATPMHPASGVSSGLQGSPSMVVGSISSSSPSSLNSSARDARYGLPRSASLSADEQQQRMQQYNQMISNRSVPQPNASASGALPGTDCGARVLPGLNGMGLASGVNRSMPMARPGFQGIASSPIVNSGSMVSPGMPSANMHSGVGPSQGSSVLRPREPLQMMRPGLGQESSRPMMPDHQMQASAGNSQVAHFGGLSSPFAPNQNASSPVPPSYTLHHQPPHPTSPQHPQVLASHNPHFPGPPANHAPTTQQQAYTMRLAKDRQQQHRFASSNSLAPHHHMPQPQLHVSSPSQNNSTVQPQTGSPTVSLSSLTPVSSVKQQAPTLRNAPAGGNGLPNQTSKQRQRQFSQANRQHPQQRQPQQSGKVAKGVGRGNSLMHQNVTIDHSLVNGVSTSQGKFASPQSSNQSLPLQKKNSVSLAKHLHQMTTHTDNSNQLHVPAVAPGQPVSSLVTTSSKARGPQQTTSHQKLVNQNRRVVQSNCQANSDPSNKSKTSSDQHQTSSSAEMDTLATTLPKATSGGTNATQIGSEPLLEPNALNSATNTSSLASMPSNTSELAAQGQGLGQRQLSVNLPSNIGQSHQQLASAHSQQQAQLLQAGNGDLYGRPTDHRLE